MIVRIEGHEKMRLISCQSEIGKDRVDQDLVKMAWQSGLDIRWDAKNLVHTCTSDEFEKWTELIALEEKGALFVSRIKDSLGGAVVDTVLERGNVVFGQSDPRAVIDVMHKAFGHSGNGRGH